MILKLFSELCLEQPLQSRMSLLLGAFPVCLSPMAAQSFLFYWQEEETELGLPTAASRTFSLNGDEITIAVLGLVTKALVCKLLSYLWLWISTIIDVNTTLRLVFCHLTAAVNQQNAEIHDYPGPMKSLFGSKTTFVIFSRIKFKNTKNKSLLCPPSHTHTHVEI